MLRPGGKSFSIFCSLVEPFLVVLRCLAGFNCMLGTGDPNELLSSRVIYDLINRVVEGGIAPMDVLVSANSLAAEAMKMSDQIGTIAPGLEADHVVFVMKGGVVYKNEVYPMQHGSADFKH